VDRAQLIGVLKATGCVVERGDVFFLCDAKWAADEVAKLNVPVTKMDEGWLCVPTGGTSGGVRFARHDEHTLTAAVRGFCAHFGIERVNAVNVLPAHHVSGLMARVRCAETGGKHLAWSWKQLEAGERPVLGEERGDWVLSLVPTQLQRLLRSAEAVAWLRGFKVIFIGGGPVWAELTDAAAAEQLPLSLSYGMTETAAMVAALKPEEFLVGARSSGAAMPHATITLSAEGVVRIAGESVFRGYWPDTVGAREFQTEDLGRFDERGQLHLLGRRDAVIITGGQKVQPLEVETALRASGEFDDVAVVGVADAVWGEAVVACYAVGKTEPDLARAVANLHGPLKPKRFVAITDWPRNAQGKINRALLKQLASAQ
jgi:O-succinylbenzoic acid--CoA ligase